MRICGLPPDSRTRTLADGLESAQSDAERPRQGQQALAPVRYLEDIPVAKSLSEAMQFATSSADEFSAEFGQQAG